MEFMSTVETLHKISIAQQMSAPALDLRSSNRPLDYTRFETGALNQAFLAVQESPGNEWDIWREMADVFIWINQELRARGAYELELISYGTFLALLEVMMEQLDE